MKYGKIETCRNDEKGAIIMAEQSLKDFRKKEFNYALNACAGVVITLQKESNDEEAAAFMDDITGKIREYMEKNEIENQLGR
jgi:hypothetical protein